MTNITQSEWLAALETAMKTSASDDAGATMEEIAAIWGVSTKTANVRMRRLRDRLITGRRRGTNLGGVPCWHHTYRLKP